MGLRAKDLYDALCGMRPGMEEYIGNAYPILLCHIEERVAHEVLHTNIVVDPENLVLPPPHDDIYWKYILPQLDLGLGKVEMYREGMKVFQEAWNRLCRHVHLEGTGFLVFPDGIPGE